MKSLKEQQDLPKVNISDTATPLREAIGAKPLTSEDLDKLYNLDDNGQIIDPTQVKTREELERLYNEDKLDVNGVLVANAWQNLQKDGLLNLSPRDANVLENTGRLSNLDGLRYAEYRDNKLNYYLNEFSYQTLHGLGEALNNAKDLAVATSSALNPMKLIERANEWHKGVERGEDFSQLIEAQKNLDFGDDTKDKLNFTALYRDAPDTFSNTGKVIGQFLLPFAGVSKGLNISNAFVKGMTAGAVTDFTFSNSHEQRLSDLIEQSPLLSNSVTSYLKSSKDDSLIEGRLKATLEGAGLGFTFEALIKGLSYSKNMLMTKANGDPNAYASLVQKIAKEDPFVNVSKEEPKAMTEAIEAQAPKAEVKETAQAELKEAEPIKAPAEPESFSTRMYSKEDIVKEIENIEQEIKRGSKKVTHKQVSEVADKYNVDMDIMKDTFRGVKDLNVKVVAFDRVITQFGKDLFDEIKAFKEAGMSDTRVGLELYQKLTQHGRMQTIFKGISREIGRGLNAHKLKGKNPIKELTDDELEGSLTSLGGAKQINDKLNAFYDAYLVSQKSANAVSKASNNIAWWEDILNGRTAAILSGISTHAANILGNISMIGLRETEHLLAPGIRSAMDMDTKAFREYKYKAIGRTLGFLDSVKLAKLSKEGKNGSAIQAFLTGRPVTDVGEKWLESSTGKVTGVFGKVIDPETGKLIPRSERQALEVMDWVREFGYMTIFRSLTFADEVFKASAYRGELYRQAVETMNEQGLTFANKTEMRAYLDNVVNNPTKLQIDNAKDIAQRETFTSPITHSNPFDRATQKAMYMLATPSSGANVLPAVIQQLASNPNPFVQGIVRNLIPFRTTPTNVFKEALRYTPLAMFSRQWLSDVAKGGTRRTQAFVKMAIGAAYIASVVELWEAGLITGRADDRHRGTQKIGELPEYSIFIDGKAYSYARYEPFATLTAFVVNMLNAWNSKDADEEQQDEMYKRVLAAAVGTFTDKTYMKGIGDFINAWTKADEGSGFERYGKSLAASYVPYNALGRYLRENKSEYKEDKDGLGDYLKASTPFFIGDIPLLLDLFGDPTEKTPKMLLGTIAYKGLYDDPIKTELLRVGFNYEPLRNPKIRKEGTEIELKNTDKANIKMRVKELGLKEALASVINSDGYNSILLNADKRAYLTEIVSTYYNAAIDEYVWGNKDNIDKLKENLNKKVEAMRDPNLAMKVNSIDNQFKILLKDKERGND